MAIEVEKLAETVEGLKKQVEALSERAGGMLSRVDFRKRIIARETAEKYAELTGMVTVDVRSDSDAVTVAGMLNGGAITMGYTAAPRMNTLSEMQFAY